VTRLAVVPNPEVAERARVGLRARLPEEAEPRVRVGVTVEQILAEQAEGFYDFVVLPPSARGGGSPVDELGPELLEKATTPLLFAVGTPGDLGRVLICTAVGEPGKADVRLGGWLAGRMGAAVTLLHVVRSEEESARATRVHLDLGVSTLAGLEVTAESRIRKASTAVDGILAEAEEGKYGLVVIGGHGPRSGFRRGREADVTLQVLRRATRPVLVVPAASW
jgi:nucleotide-binding universal stress UspA family protein